MLIEVFMLICMLMLLVLLVLMEVLALRVYDYRAIWGMYCAANQAQGKKADNDFFHQESP